MTNLQKHNGGNAAMGALGFAVAAAIGAALGLAFAPKSGEETRADIAKEAQRLAKSFKQSKEHITETLQSVFGTVSDELEETYVDIRGHILAAMDDIKDKKQLTQKRFEQIVDDTVKDFADKKEWAADKVSALTDRIKAEWKDIKAELS